MCTSAYIEHELAQVRLHMVQRVLQYKSKLNEQSILKISRVNLHLSIFIPTAASSSVAKHRQMYLWMHKM